MKIASWNVNSIRVRLPHVKDFVNKQKPDVLLLQELKAKNEDIPSSELEDLGYNITYKGQKAYNGVAILSKYPIDDVAMNLYEDNNEEEQARYIECWIDAKNRGIRVASIYLPNGNPINTEKFTYKLEWMDRLKQRVKELLNKEECVVLGGDFNICPEDRDAAQPETMKNDALFQPESRAKFREIINLGYYDAWRSLYPDKTNWSYWDYGRAFEQNKGLRIDHFLLSPLAVDRLKKVEIDTYHRSLEKPSDHAPIIIELND
jgi:exodeoxyribonuclease III